MKLSLLTTMTYVVLLVGWTTACGEDSTIIQPGSTDGTDNGSDPKGTGGTGGKTCTPADTFVGTHGQLHVEGRDLKNQCGEKVRLKGVSSMWLNWEMSGYAESRNAMKWMIDNWNIKVIRAAMGIDAQNGYLSNPSRAESQVRAIVENAIELGIYVIIDWHSHNADNESQTQKAVAFFTKMATDYGDKPNVLYETWNEPLQVDWSTVVKPYHETLVGAIRKVDPDNIIILGTPQWSQKVTDALADPVAGENLMYTVHFYSCDHGSQLIDMAWHAYFNGVPVFVTEWGAATADGGVSDKRVCEDEAEDWFNILDKMNASWAAWKLDDCTDVSCLLKGGAPKDGPWDNYLQGHGPYVVRKLLED